MTEPALSLVVDDHDLPNDPDAFVRHIGELFELAAFDDDTPGNTERAIRAIALAARGGLSGATASVVDHAIVCIAQAVDAVGEHFADQISTTDTELALRSAGGILRTFTAHLHASDRPPALEFEMWVDGVSIFYHQLRIADLTRRVLARGRQHNLGKAHAPSAPSSMH